MANAGRGLVELELDGEMRTLRFPNSVMRTLCERFEVKSPMEVWGKISTWSADDWAEVMRLGLSKGSEKEITAADVDDMILGTELPYYAAVISDAVSSSTDGRNVSERVQKVMKDAVDKSTGVAAAEAANPQ